MKKVFFLIITAIFLTGCVTTTKQSSNSEQYYKQKIIFLEKQIETLQNKISQLEQQKKIATTETEKEKILKELSTLSSKQQENIAYLEQIKKDIYDIKTNLKTSSTSSKNKYSSYLKYKQLKNKKNKTPVAPTLSKSERYYKKCYKFVEQSKFKNAEKCFKNFIKKYSKSSLIPNAYFWIGETYFSRKNYAKAIDYYDIILTKFIKSEKVAAALLKEGLSFYNLNDREGAQIFLEKVISDYPNTPQAKYAKKYIEKYNLK